MMKITLEDGREIEFRPGDVLDLNVNGYLVWYTGMFAEAKRIEREAQCESNRELIERIRNENA